MKFINTKHRALMVVVFIFLLVSASVLTLLSLRGQQAESLPPKVEVEEDSQAAPQDHSSFKLENDQQLAMPEDEENSEEYLPKKVNQEEKEQVKETSLFIANQEDIQMASTEEFPFTHVIRDDGAEWIMAGVEDYQVLSYAEPLLKSQDIRGIQETLQKLHLYDGAIDGIYGPKTEAAVKEFQQDNGLEPTGIVDLDDYTVLARAYEEAIPALAVKKKPKGKVDLLVILDERLLYVLDDGEIFHKFPVAIGKPETPSPLGNWKVISKDSWSGGFGTRWLGLNVQFGRYGIHGTNKPWSISGAESHGCFRMFNRDVETLYQWATWGTRVYVSGGDFPYNLPRRELSDGDRGSDVWSVQNRLRELGYYPSKPDGVYGWGTRNAIEKFQKDQGIKVDGKAGWTTINKLGLYLFQ